jgi:hypothetical protein
VNYREKRGDKKNQMEREGESKKILKGRKNRVIKSRELFSEEI